MDREKKNPNVYLKTSFLIRVVHLTSHPVAVSLSAGIRHVRDRRGNLLHVLELEERQKSEGFYELNWRPHHRDSLVHLFACRDPTRRQMSCLPIDLLTCDGLVPASSGSC